MSLATFSDELKIFNSDESFSLSASTKISKTPGTFGKITWSGDAKWIAATPSKDPLIVYKFKDNDLTPMKYVTLTSVTSASFLNWTNRNIAVGTETGDIYVWDLKEKRIEVNTDVEQRHSVDHICVNSDDTCLASASLSKNKICIHSLKTNKVVHTYSMGGTDHVSSLSFCMCKKSYLGASSYESSVYVWDIIRSDVIFKSLNSHCGACTGISFSPINYSVLASVGLTKKLKMYDLREKRSIFDVNMGESLQCVDMIANGDKVSVGTSGGSMILFDLRANKVLNQIKAHEGPVLSVKMQEFKVPKMYQEVEMNTPDPTEVQSKTLDLSVMDVFSPICRNSGNASIFSAKTVSFHSTPKVITEGQDSVVAYNDSFLSKVLSPKSEKILMSTPIEHSSSVIRNKDFVNNTEKLEAVEEEPPETPEPVLTIKNNGVIGDEVHKPVPSTTLENFITEMRKIHKEQQESIKRLSEEISSVKIELHKKIEENYENLVEILINGLKKEIDNGNCEAKLDHVCQRLLINNFINLVTEKNDKIIKDMESFSEKINYIHTILTGGRK